MSRVIGFLTADDDADPAATAKRVLGLGGVHLHSSDLPRFDQLVDALMPSQVPSSATVEQARRNAEERTAFLAEVGALTAEDVHRISGSTADNTRSTASRWSLEGRIFGVEWRDRKLYPAFQFDSDGRPLPVVQEVLGLLPAALVGWARALWWATESAALGWERPLDVIDQPDRLRAAARAEAASWAHAAGEDVPEPVFSVDGDATDHGS